MWDPPTAMDKTKLEKSTEPGSSLCFWKSRETSKYDKVKRVLGVGIAKTKKEEVAVKVIL